MHEQKLNDPSPEFPQKDYVLLRVLSFIHNVKHMDRPDHSYFLLDFCQG